MSSTAFRRPNRRATVLLLDDDPKVAAFVSEALTQKHYELIWVQTIEKALNAVDHVQPDLTLVDIVLGRESGFDFVREMRKRNGAARTPVIMLTSSDQVPDRELSLQMGADRYLVKPVNAQTLQRVVNELLAARDDIWWTLSLKTHQVDRIRELLFDTTTEVPTLALVVEQLRSRVEAGETLNVYCIELEPLFRTDERNYWDSFDALRREFVRAVHFVLSPLIGRDPIVATSHAGANDFYIFVAQDKSVQPATTAREIEMVLREMLRDIDVDPFVAEEVAIFVGGATTQGQTLYAPRVLYNAVREAKDLAEKRESRYYQALSDRLARAIREQTIRTVFQPIVELGSGRIIGYEALSRGPAGTEIESPEIIFDLARDLQLVWELETVCIENLRPILEQVCSKGLLFFNLESHFIQQLQSRGTEVLELLLSCDRRVVIEVTERSAIRDYGNFRRTLAQLKHMGFQIAVDDCGSGYASLEAVAELHPEYLKVGHSLFHGLESDPVRRRIVDLVARCADTIGAVTIAEAIETEEQLRICRELNIQYGQGYWFARPAAWESIVTLPPVLTPGTATVEKR